MNGPVFGEQSTLTHTEQSDLQTTRCRRGGPCVHGHPRP